MALCVTGWRYAYGCAKKNILIFKYSPLLYFETYCDYFVLGGWGFNIRGRGIHHCHHCCLYPCGACTPVAAHIALHTLNPTSTVDGENLAKRHSHNDYGALGILGCAKFPASTTGHILSTLLSCQLLLFLLLLVSFLYQYFLVLILQLVTWARCQAAALRPCPARSRA